MIVNIYFGDEPSTNFTTFVLDPVSFPTDYCFNHTYVTAGTYDVFVVLSNNRSSANDTQTIDVDGLFTCNLTLNHSEYLVTPGMITLQASGAYYATRLATTLDLGNGIVLAEGPSGGIDCFDPVAGVKTWNWTYNSTGIYDIEVNASNSHDSCSIRGVLGVNERILNLTINTTGDTNLTEPTFFTQTLLAGSNVVCEHHFDDQLVTIHYCELPDPVFDFNHTYAEVGLYNCKIYCYNYLDYFEFPFDIYVQIPIIDFAWNETMFLLRYGGPLELGFSMQNGTNVTVFSTVNGENATQTYEFGDLVGHVSLETYPAGFSTLETIAFNKVSRVELTTLLQIEKNVTGLMASYNGQSGEAIYFTPADSVKFNLSIEDGTFPKFTLDFGDGTTPNLEESFGTVENKTEYEIPNAVTFTEGYYTMNFTAENNVSSESALILIGVEYPVVDFTVAYQNVSDTSLPVTFEVTDASPNTPTGPSIVFSYGVVTETDDESPLFDFSTMFSQPHTFQNYGVFMVTVNVSNNVSSLAKIVVVQVGLPMQGIQLNASKCADTNETVEFIASVELGSDVTFTFNAKDDICPDYIQQEPTTQDYSQPWNHTFNYSYPLPGLYLARVNASSPLNTGYDTTEIKVENSLNGTKLPQPEPQILNTGNPPAQFIFEAEYLPTDATCVFIYGDGQSVTDVAMTFTDLVMTHTYSYSREGTYPLEVSCTNCQTALNVTYDVDADYFIAQTDITLPATVLQTNFDYDFTCIAREGSRIRYSIYYDNETLEDTSLEDPTPTEKVFRYQYPAPTNTTVRCRFNNSVSDISEMKDVVVQHKVDTITLSTADSDNCVQVNVPSPITVTHTPIPHPTDPFLSYTTSTDGQSGSIYSDSLMTTGTDTLTLTFTIVDNETITLNTSNLFDYQMTTLNFAVQKTITDVTMATASGILFAAVDEETLFYATITGSHASVSINWGDGVTGDPYYFDGELDSKNSEATHTYSSAQAGLSVTIQATATNCFTSPQTSNNLVIEIQHKVNMSNMIIDYPNPVTTPDGSLTFNISIKPGEFAPTAPRCRINYTDLQNVQQSVSDGAVSAWPFEQEYNFQAVGVQVQVELEIKCLNDVSEDTHTATLVLEQPIVDLDIARPDICETKKPCMFNITMTSGNNLNVTITITDATDPKNFRQLASLNAIPREHIFQNQSTYNITVRAFNHINDSTVTRSIETRHTVENLQIDFPEFVNLKKDSGALKVEVAAGGGEIPAGVQISLQELGASEDYIDAPWKTNAKYIAEVNYTFTDARAYDMKLSIHNEVTRKEKIFTAYGEYPIINLKVVLMDDNDIPTTEFLRNTVVKITGNLIGHVEEPTDVMYSIKLPNFENLSPVASWSHVASSPGDPWICNVTARNNVTNITTLTEFKVIVDFPILNLEHVEKTIEARETCISATVQRQFENEDVAVCFSVSFPCPGSSPDDAVHYRGEKMDECKTRFGNDFKATAFNESVIEIIDDSTYSLKMCFILYNVGMCMNSEIFAGLLRRNTVTYEFEEKPGDRTYSEVYNMEVEAIPCSVPYSSPLVGVPGNNVTYPYVTLRALPLTLMISQFYSVNIDCQRTTETLITYTFFAENDGVYDMVYLSNYGKSEQIPMGYYIEKNVLNYTMYVVNVSIVMGTTDLNYPEFSTWVPIYINVTETPLTCSIKTGDSIILGKSWPSALFLVDTEIIFVHWHISQFLNDQYRIGNLHSF